ncbi:MAG: CPBP family intramembrane metalloprotease [Cyanobacteria bacterium NC_groundwater_1444_Ag_S-0.65um_54_12]|nr:CPBP family intramembrane metalloprotease [Cyanobacteria bacterium NC_groundwater_1444_Ag_S-0.65um_54_12]
MPREPGLWHVVLLLLILAFAPVAIASWWVRLGITDPRGLFFPIEILAVLLPTLLLARSSSSQQTLLWRRCSLTAVFWAVVGTLGWSSILTFLQTWWEQLTGIKPSWELQALLTIRSPGDLVLLLVGAALLPGFCEELAFRGFILTRFERWGGMVSIVLTTILFAGFHQELYGLPTYLGMGAFLGILAYRSRSLWPGIAAHATNNSLALVQINVLPESWWWQHGPWLLPLAATVAIIGTWYFWRLCSQHASSKQYLVNQVSAHDPQ